MDDAKAYSRTKGLPGAGLQNVDKATFMNDNLSPTASRPSGHYGKAKHEEARIRVGNRTTIDRSNARSYSTIV